MVCDLFYAALIIGNCLSPFTHICHRNSLLTICTSRYIFLMEHIPMVLYTFDVVIKTNRIGILKQKVKSWFNVLIAARNSNLKNWNVPDACMNGIRKCPTNCPKCARDANHLIGIANEYEKRRTSPLEARGRVSNEILVLGESST
jgi:hypothetical protein